jgi:hypothetical protein
MKNIPRHPKLRGEWAEVRFLARASELGLRVSKPYGDCLPYDFIVEHRGRMFRVQVKSTSFRNPGCGSYKCLIRPPRRPRYPIEAIDFIAAYVFPEDVWYLIPYSELTTGTSISLDPRSQRNCYRQYREAWDLLLTESLSALRRRKKSELMLARGKGGKASPGRIGRPLGGSGNGASAAE